jgi:hypothetical protein
MVAIAVGPGATAGWVNQVTVRQATQILARATL